MSGIQDISITRRLQALAERLSDLERMVETLSQVPAAPAAPRDIWLGRTTAGGQTYPTSGNTFRVELIRGDYATTAGDTEVTEYRRGTIVTAHTWPDAYIPEDSQVIVMRMRGKQGPGEWWIETHSVDLSTMWGEMIGGYADEASGNVGIDIEAGGGTWSDPLSGTLSGPAVPAALRDIGHPPGTGRGLTLAPSGLYDVRAWVHCALQPGSRLTMPDEEGRQYNDQHINVALTILRQNAEVGAGYGFLSTKRYAARATIHAAMNIRCNSLDTLDLVCNMDGWAGGYDASLSVWRWRLYAVRIGD